MVLHAKTSSKFDSEYKPFLRYNKKIAKKIRELMDDILEHPTTGIGKPERLKYSAGNTWSRHIDDKNRLVYSIGDGYVLFRRCRGHYDDR
ncbi:MAG: Txe/YoeB family addiction module toxin [Puniceicoccales bacterium]|jgi:toxin YoeB|nr:Txe/YoeB family addiction module toxin [Puniceicoccales bacterium]